LYIFYIKRGSNLCFVNVFYGRSRGSLLHYCDEDLSWYLKYQKELFRLAPNSKQEALNIKLAQ
jgi:hypothetical protein